MTGIVMLMIIFIIGMVWYIIKGDSDDRDHPEDH